MIPHAISASENPTRTRWLDGSIRLLVAAAALLVATRLFAADAGKPVKVFVFAGQSNMEGADAHPERIDDFPMFKGAGAPQPDVLYARLAARVPDPSNVWGPLQPVQSFGPELTFARFVKRHDDAPIAIIKSAVGGTTVAFDWNPDAPDQGQKLYPRTLDLVRGALRELDKRGVRHQLEGVMWHQGENDMLDRGLNTNYAAGLASLIERFRKDLEEPQLKWFMAEVSEKGIWGMDNRRNLAILRQQQELVLKADPLVRWVPTSHLAFEVMDSGQPHYHFGTQGQLQMGEAFASAYLDSVGKAPRVKERVFAKGLPTAGKSRVRLFVLAGQRNMEGEDSFVSEIASEPGYRAVADDQQDVLFRYSLGGAVKVSRTWEPLGPVDHLGTFGPELSLGARLARSLDAKDGIAIVKFTHGGAQGPDWFPRGSPESRRDLYPRFIAFVRDAIQDLARQGHEVSLEGLFWHVGENDTYFRPYAEKQAAWMKDLVAQTRLDLGQPDLTWFISEQHPRAIWRNMDAVNAALNTMAQSERRVFLIKTGSLPHARLHFGTRGTLLLGEEYAKAYLGTR